MVAIMRQNGMNEEQITPATGKFSSSIVTADHGLL